MSWPPIGDYAAIGNCRTVALISRDGALEWLCLPHYSGPALFAAILDRNAGHFSIRPRGGYRVERQYVDKTNVLQTTFHCEGGAVVRLTDCMPLPAEPSADMQTAHELDPEHEVLRQVECISGEAEVEVVFAPRAAYGRRVPRFRHRGKVGWQLVGCGFGAFVASEIELSPEPGDGALRGTAKLRAGESRWCSFCYDESEASVIAPLGDLAHRRRDDTIGWWRWWSGRMRYHGKYTDAVLRSALTLKLLNSCTSGAVLAAPTTSLPEEIGGTRNWDYRFCWLRDSSLVLHAFFSLGFVEEGEGFLGWLLHATRLTWPRLQVMYDLYGETRLKEKWLRHLTGYRDSSPVRIGNAAHEQLQLDIYGELVATVAQYVDAGGKLDSSERRMLAGLAQSVCELWRLPDHGIWETRRAPRHHTYSKGMCWVALDRLCRMNVSLALGLDQAKIERERDELRAEIETRGFNERLGAYVGYYDGEEADASLLLLARHGYQPPEHPRMKGTWRLIEQQLSLGGLLLRYPQGSGYDGISGAENLFAPCSFWGAEYLANCGRLAEAQQLFERLLGCANDLGLYAEEIVPGTGEPVGNFPQAFTHVSMISAATALTVEKTA
ncbi:MAG TPA: glycoside hydrolase family 15 protein [Burkholderiales bacterium]|nr:glycoside hydrolase family 15 protein [Burkholderiales bacterium]